MRVKNHKIRAKVALTKPLTTHLMRGKGDFSCSGGGRVSRGKPHGGSKESHVFLAGFVKKKNSYVFVMSTNARGR